MSGKGPFLEDTVDGCAPSAPAVSRPMPSEDMDCPGVPLPISNVGVVDAPAPIPRGSMPGAGRPTVLNVDPSVSAPILDIDGLETMPMPSAVPDMFSMFVPIPSVDAPSEPASILSADVPLPIPSMDGPKAPPRGGVVTPGEGARQPLATTAATAFPKLDVLGKVALTPPEVPEAPAAGKFIGMGIRIPMDIGMPMYCCMPIGRPIGGMPIGIPMVIGIPPIAI